MIRYVHTNIIAKDAVKLCEFYKNVLGCRSINEKRDLRGQWLDDLIGNRNAHITGEHLCLPGYDDDHPTLEIFSYDDMIDGGTHAVNQYGIAHLCFETDDVEGVLNKILKSGGSQVGDLVHADYDDGRHAIFVYARDPEGNILEIQSWS